MSNLRDYDKFTPAERRERALQRAELRASGILMESAAHAQDHVPAKAKPSQENIGLQSPHAIAIALEELVDAGVSDIGVSPDSVSQSYWERWIIADIARRMWRKE